MSTALWRKISRIRIKRFLTDVFGLTSTSDVTNATSATVPLVYEIWVTLISQVFTLN